jgi:hypothetical protein
MSTQRFKVGASKRKITPTPDVGPVYRAGYKMGEAEQLTKVVDDICLRCITVEADATRVVFLSLDLIGLFRDFTDELASRLGTHGVGAGNLMVATTHTHAGPDTMGVWGPSFGQSGYNEAYGEFLLGASTEAVTEALGSARPAQPFLSFTEKNLGVTNFREPDELSLALWCVSFRADDRVLGSLISYTAQPELAPRDDDGISGDYPGEACRILDEELGGTTLFLLGVCGGMEPQGCEEGYEIGHAYGKKVADELLSLSPSARPIDGETLVVTGREAELPVENPGFQLMMEHGVFKTSRKPPNALATLSRVKLGEITIFTLPGETFPGIVADIGPRGRALFANQVNDSLGYFIPPEQFRSEPVQWAEGHHFTGHELESLGRQAGEIVRRELAKLAS